MIVFRRCSYLVGKTSWPKTEIRRKRKVPSLTGGSSRCYWVGTRTDSQSSRLVFTAFLQFPPLYAEKLKLLKTTRKQLTAGCRLFISKIFERTCNFFVTMCPSLEWQSEILVKKLGVLCVFCTFFEIIVIDHLNNLWGWGLYQIFE